jgi:hypothetical protein
MTRRGLFGRGIVGLMAATIGAMLTSACGWLFSERYRFKMTVEVETPEGLKTGYSVYQVGAGNNNFRLLPDENARGWSVKGEAVAVDLPGGQTLFALLKTGADHGDLAGLSMETLDPLYKNDVVESAQRISAGHALHGAVVVPPTRWRELLRTSEDVPNYPLLVRFKDAGDPTSVELVDPADLAKSFGPGVKLSRITVAVTDEDVTTGIEGRLPDSFWKNWSQFRKAEMSQNGGVMKNPYFRSFAGNLSRNDFTSEHIK